eukprot:TRINITY_DN11740_c0_g1_i2.p1 TRINITY_DN11740_c0_g1~~TRINITY_DN11740_c0_g1_i2.p1  ORF type:complete len:674 (+),score=158.27 TRINITY_DN11740_c0_g1_i2:621-2642(+)
MPFGKRFRSSLRRLLSRPTAVQLPELDMVELAFVDPNGLSDESLQSTIRQLHKQCGKKEHASMLIYAGTHPLQLADLNLPTNKVVVQNMSSQSTYRSHIHLPNLDSVFEVAAAIAAFEHDTTIAIPGQVRLLIDQQHSPLFATLLQAAVLAKRRQDSLDLVNDYRAMVQALEPAIGSCSSSVACMHEWCMQACNTSLGQLLHSDASLLPKPVFCVVDSDFTFAGLLFHELPISGRFHPCVMAFRDNQMVFSTLAGGSARLPTAGGEVKLPTKAARGDYLFRIYNITQGQRQMLCSLTFNTLLAAPSKGGKSMRIDIPATAMVPAPGVELRKTFRLSVMFDRCMDANSSVASPDKPVEMPAASTPPPHVHHQAVELTLDEPSGPVAPAATMAIAAADTSRDEELARQMQDEFDREAEQAAAAAVAAAAVEDADNSTPSSPSPLTDEERRRQIEQDEAFARAMQAELAEEVPGARRRSSRRSASHADNTSADNADGDSSDDSAAPSPVFPHPRLMSARNDIDRQLRQLESREAFLAERRRRRHSRRAWGADSEDQVPVAPRASGSESRMHDLLRMLLNGEAMAPPQHRVEGILSSLPCATVTAGSPFLGHSCQICMGEYEVGEEVVTLPCLDRYHQGCIATWLQQKPTCPCCNNRVDQSFRELQRAYDSTDASEA